MYKEKEKSKSILVGKTGIIIPVTPLAIQARSKHFPPFYVPMSDAEVVRYVGSGSWMVVMVVVGERGVSEGGCVEPSGWRKADLDAMPPLSKTKNTSFAKERMQDVRFDDSIIEDSHLVECVWLWYGCGGVFVCMWVWALKV